MLRFSYETLTNSWFYGEWIVKIIAKVMILIIHFVLHKKRRETMKEPFISVLISEEKLNERIAQLGEQISKDYEGNSQFVTAVVSGNGKLKSINIDMEELASDDREILEDMVLVAVNNAIGKMEKDKEEKFGKYGQMFNGLM